MGTGNVIGPNCSFGPDVSIGNDNYFQSHVSVGSPPEHRGFWNDHGQGVEIGDNNRFSSFVTVDSGCFRTTQIDNGVAFLSHAHCGHDSLVERDCTISCGAKIGGESIIMRGSNIGLNAVIHQRQIIGSWSFIGMGAVVTKSAAIAPSEIWAGNPAKLIRQNTIGLERNKVSDIDLALEVLRFNELRGK